MVTVLSFAPIGAGATLLLALAFAAWRSHDRAYWLYGNVSYWCMLALALAWSWLALKRRGAFSWRAFWERRRAAVLAGLAGAALVFAAVPPRFRVLSDETNLLGVAESLALEKTAYNPTVAKRYYGVLHPLNREIEKRPLLYPFLIHALHVATGYRWQNGFAVNFLLLALLLAAVYGWACEAAGAWAGGAALVLLISYPLVSLCASSAGAELLGAVVFGSLMLSLGAYLRAPSADAWAWLWINAIAFCHTRYECFLLSGLALASAAAWERPQREWFERYWPLFALSPLLLLPIVWQRILIPKPFENAPGDPPFSPRHFLRFSKLLIKTQLKPYDELVPHAVIVNWAAAACAGAFAYGRWSGRTAAPERRTDWWLATAVACLGAQSLIFLCYYFGDYVHPASARFFLAVSIGGALVPVAFHAAYPDRLPRAWLVALAAVAAAVYFPVAVNGRHTDTLELIRETHEVHRHVLEQDDEHAFYIYSRPGQITVLDRGAADFAWANRRVESLLNELDRHLYSGIWTYQRVSYATGKPVKDDALDAGFALEPVSEIQITAEETLRVSRVLRPAATLTPRK